MKKHFFLLMTSIVMAITALASPAEKTMEEIIGVSVEKKDEGYPHGRPHAPALRLFSAFVDTNSNTLFVSSRYDVGEVSATIENTTAGDIYSYTFDSADTALLPINCTAGFWTITLTLDSGAVFVGEFQL